jgi:hypothetical protein
VLSRLSMPAKNQDLRMLKADITESAQLDLRGLLRIMND